MPKAITAIAKLVRPLTAVVRFFTDDDAYEVASRAQPRARRRFRRELNG